MHWTLDSKGTGQARRRTLLAALLVLAWALAGLAEAGQAASCNCALTGAWKNPESTGVSTTSPRFTVQATGSGPINLTVRRSSNNTTVLSLAGVPLSSAWGFSPDGDRFVHHYVTGGLHTVTLYDLSGSTSRQVWTTSATTGSSRIRFSPHGDYLLYAYLQGTNFTNLRVVDTDAPSNAALVFQTGFTYALPPGNPGSSVGSARWGFSSDPDDSAFGYEFSTGGTSFQWNVVNLETRQTVVSQTVIGSYFWQFSPCADVVGLVHQTSQSFQEISVFRTSNGQQLTSQTFPLATAVFNTTSTQHLVTVGGTTSNLTTNNASSPCGGTTPAATLTALTATPSSVTGGSTAQGKVTLSANAPSGGAVVSLTSGNAAVTLPASTTVSAGSSTKTFSVTTAPVTSTRAVTLTASYGGVSRTATLTLTPAAAARPVSSLTLNPASVVGGGTSTGTVALTGATGATAVTFTSSDPAVVPAPASLTVPSGTPSGAFTLATNAVSSPTNVVVTATAGGASASATLTVTPAPTGGTNAIDPNPGCNAERLPRNDDGSTGAVGLPFPVNFFGTTYTFLYINNNGNVTFREPLGTYTPFRIGASTPPIIAPFFADVDTRPTGSDEVRYAFGAITFAGRPAFCVNWVNVGYYNQHADKLNDIQLVVVDRSDTGPGNFDMYFNYNRIAWETGDASGGFNGFGGTSAGAGYSAGTGNASEFFEFPGSLVNGGLLDSNASTGLTRTSRNSTVLGRHVFEVRNGAAPAGGTLTGRVTDAAASPSPQPNAPVHVTRASDGAVVFATLTNALGRYTATGLPEDDYNVTAFPPAGSSLQRASAGPVHVVPGAGASQDVVLLGLVGISAGTTITPSSPGGGGVPTVYWGNPLELSTTGCAGGTANYAISVGGTVVASGPMAEGPAGTYAATVPPLRPSSGRGEVTISIDCPGDQDEERKFDLYIDPSGLVLTISGDPVPDATVTLYRSDAEAGPFEVVPNGSFVMSPANRRNPDLTDETGHFGWDVIPGFYKVRVEKEGCHAPGDPGETFVETGVLEIPPPVFDLDLRLECEGGMDATPPTLGLPADMTVEATGPAGATVTYEVTAVDDVDGSIAPACSPAPGATFRLGATAVECTATDAAGNSTNGGFTIRVVDTAAPRLTVPPDATVDATGPGGATHAFAVRALDEVDPSPEIACAPSSGSRFPVGTTTVRCTATDDAGNSAAATFTVSVRGAAAQLADLIAKVDATAMKRSLEKKLLHELRQAQAQLQNGNAAKTCFELGQFAKQADKHSPKQLAGPAADDLLVDAARIRAVLAC